MYCIRLEARRQGMAAVLPTIEILLNNIYHILYCTRILARPGWGLPLDPPDRGGSFYHLYLVEAKKG